MSDLIEENTKCGHPLYWHNCYTGAYDLIESRSYSHPAKMSPALCFRILSHLEELGLANKEQDTILDPMAGTGLTAICAGAKGYKAITVELESKFVDLQQGFLCDGVLHYTVEREVLPPEEAGWKERATGGFVDGELEYKRYYSKALPERVKYRVKTDSRCGIKDWHKVHRVIGNKEYAEKRLYKSLDWTMLRGDSRQLSSLLKEGGLKSVVSPPYSDSLSGKDKGWEKLADDPTSQRYGRKSHPSVGQEYSDNPENIGNLKDTPLKSITSPPYQDSQGHPSLGSVNKDDWGKEGKDIVKRRGLSGEYGDSEGQVGNLKSITSPPYANRVDDHGVDQKGFEGFTDKLGTYGESQGQIGKLKDKPLKSITSPPYGSDNANLQGRTDPSAQSVLATTGMRGEPLSGKNIGNLKDTPLKSIVSPPYGESIKGGKSGIEWQEEWGKPSESRQPSQDVSYSESKENIGNLSDKPLKRITSPPYEGGGHHKGMLDSWGGEDTPVSDKTKDDHGYGNTEGQVEKAESYLSAMKTVYSEIAKVSDVLCVVVKCPTRVGKLRRLDLDTISILEASNWSIHCVHRALLFEELEQSNMFDGTTKKVKGRLSFFKRLSYQKGQPVANWEDIIVCTRR